MEECVYLPEKDVKLDAVKYVAEPETLRCMNFWQIKQ